MNEIINNLKCDVYNGEKNYCMLSEEMLNAIKELSKKEEQELQKYKSLYENEKDHTDTLKRIIKEVKETLERHLTARDYSNHKYELFGREYLEELLNLLDLLKEIK